MHHTEGWRVLDSGVGAQAMRRLLTLLAVALLAVATTGCPKPPRKALADAQSALSNAREAEECAPEEYAAARKMLERANKASAEGEYARAREYAEAAKALADKATLVAQKNLAKCRQRKIEATAPPKDDDEGAPLMPPDFGDDWTLRTVFFDYNSAQLAPEARETLEKNAEWLLTHKEGRVLIGGHCDDRGSTEYNLALGEQRATGVKRFLVTMGVAPDRVAVISYGEEMPIDTTGSDSGHARNRRAEFQLQ